MKLSTENISETRAKVTVAVTGDEVTAEERNALRELTRQAKIPGFRPGKAPEAMLRRRFAKELADDLKRKVLSKAYKEASENSDLDVFGLVDVSESDITPGTDVDLVFTFDLQPKIVLPEYKGIPTHVDPVDVTDDDVEKEIGNILKQRAEYNVVEREAQPSDYVKVSYKGEIDGTAIAEIVPDKQIWGTQENTWEEAGATGPEAVGVPAIIDGVVGMKVGDTKTVTQEFTDDHEVEALRGKVGTYSIEVHEVRERVMPELTDEFAQSLKVDSVEDLRNRIREELTNRATGQRRLQQRNQIADYLVNNAPFGVPESAIERETQNVMERTMRENMRRGVPEAEFDKHKEQFHAQSRQLAEKQVKRDFLLIEVARKEAIKVSNDDLHRAIMAQSQRYRVRPDDIIKELKDDQDALRSFQQSVMLEKVMEWLTDAAQVVEGDAAQEAPAQQ